MINSAPHAYVQHHAKLENKAF